MSCDEKMCCFHRFIDRALRKHRRSDIHLKAVRKPPWGARAGAPPSPHTPLDAVEFMWCPPCLPRCSANQRAAPWVFVSRFRWGLLFVEVVWRSSRRLVVSSSRCLLSCLFSSLKKFKPNLFWSKFWSMILLWLSVQTVQILSNHQIINSSFIVHHVLCRSAMRFQS